MILKFNRIIILFIAFNIITSCNPDTCYLNDCTNFEKMKVSLLDNFGYLMFEEYRSVDSLDWYFSESDSAYDVGIYIKKEISDRVAILEEYGIHIIILKKNCKATYCRNWGWEK